MIKIGQMVLKGVTCVDNKKSHVIWSGTGVNKMHSDKIGSNGLERSLLGTE